jgi:cytochrome c oxidase subunit 3
MAALVLALGAVHWMKPEGLFPALPAGPALFLVGLAGVLYTMFAWWRDVVRESVVKGDHTPVVKLGLRYGMVLFIASEVMFFVAWFWAYFHAAVDAQTRLGGTWPPAGIETFDPWHLPFLNTLVLLTSGTTVTWAHHALLHGDRKGLVRGLLLTVILGISFTCLQALEYSHAEFAFSGNIYGATFFMATGFHGAHVIIGTLFLIVCLFRAMAGHFTPERHFGFEAAAWYWHFVDVVWLFLFVCIYWWGSYVHGPVT